MKNIINILKKHCVIILIIVISMLWVFENDKLVHFIQESNVYSYLLDVLNLKNSSSLKVICIFLLLTIALIIYINSILSLFRSKYLYAPFLHLFLFFIGTLLIFFLIRFGENIYTFGYYKYDFYYLSVIMVGLVYVIKAYNYIVRNKSISKKNINDEDAIGYEHIIKNLEEEIVSGSSKSIALLGANGIGKTWVLKKVASIIKSKVEVVFFNPHFFKDSEQMMATLFNDIEVIIRKNEMNPNIRSFTYILKKYIGQKGGAFSEIVHYMVSLFRPDILSQHAIDNISKAMDSSSLKIVIFIDDYDRCNEEIRNDLLNVLAIFLEIKNVKYVIASSVDSLFYSQRENNV